MTALSTFSGIGGLDLAAEAAGFEVVGMVERDPHCQKVLHRHWPHVPLWSDIHEFTAESFRERTGIDRPTVVFGGFPCQPFSSAGKRKGDGDERFLWPELCRVLRELEPDWFVGENVRGLLSVDSGRVFGRILADLADLGYRVGWSCFGADEACRASHRRDRVFIVGYLAKPGHGRGRDLGTAGERRDRETGRAECANPVDGPGSELADSGHYGDGQSFAASDISRSRGTRSEARGQSSPRDTELADSSSLRRGGLRPIPGCDGAGQEDRWMREPSGDCAPMADAIGGGLSGRGQCLTDPQRREAGQFGDRANSADEPRDGSQDMAQPHIGGRRTFGDGSGQIATDGRGELADALHRGERRSESEDVSGIGSETGSAQVAYAIRSDEPGWINAGRDSASGRAYGQLGGRDGLFPPGPSDLDRWRRIALSDPSLLPALSREAETELQVRPSTDGLSRRMALKMLWNAVVWQQAYSIFEAIATLAKAQERVA